MYINAVYYAVYCSPPALCCLGYRGGPRLRWSFGVFHIVDGQSMRTDLTWIWLRIELAMMIYCHCYRYRCIIDRWLLYIPYKFIACPVLCNANTLNLNFCLGLQFSSMIFGLKLLFICGIIHLAFQILSLFHYELICCAIEHFER